MVPVEETNTAPMGTSLRVKALCAWDKASLMYDSSDRGRG